MGYEFLKKLTGKVVRKVSTKTFNQWITENYNNPYVADESYLESIGCSNEQINKEVESIKKQYKDYCNKNNVAPVYE